MEESAPLPAFRLDAAMERGQCERLRAVRAARSASDVERELAALETAASSGSNLMPHIVAAAGAMATVGEISDRLRSVFGEHREL